MKKMIYLLLAVAMGLIFNNSQTSAVSSPAKSKIVMKQKKVNLSVGETYRLKVKKGLSAVDKKGLTYKSKNKTIAHVTKKGVVKAKKQGKTRIVVSHKDISGIRAFVTIMVSNTHEFQNSADAIHSEWKLNNQNPINTPAVFPSPSSTPEQSANQSQTPVPDKENNNQDSTGFDSLMLLYEHIIVEEFSQKICDSSYKTLCVDYENSGINNEEKDNLLKNLDKAFEKEIIGKTRKQMETDGDIKEDEAYGYIFNDQMLITIAVKEENESQIIFDIACEENGLSAIHFVNCKAIREEMKWSYEIGRKIYS